MKHPVTRRLAVVRLEDRCTPASATLTGGVLTVLGTPANDLIAIRLTSGQLAVEDGAGAFAASAVSRIVVDAGPGNDTVLLDGVTAPATIYGGNGNDAITGGAGSDIIYGGNGNDVIDGGAGNDFITGDYGTDTVRGGAGDDALYGGADNDTVYGDAGNDYLVGSAGRDRLYGGYDSDRYLDDYAAPQPSTGRAGLVNAVASRKAGEKLFGSPADIRQQLASTCSFMTALAAVMNAGGTDPVSLIKYDYSDQTYYVPIYLNGVYTEQAVQFNGTWTDNDPEPLSGDDGGRDYWTAIYQRAYLQAHNVDTSNPDGSKWAVRGTTVAEATKQRWRYAEVALEAVTGRDAVAQSTLTAADRQRLGDAIARGRPVAANTHTLAANRPRVDGTGLVFSHAYAVMDVDATGVTLRNPWGVDTLGTNIAGWDTARRAAYTLGNESDGLVKVSWETFQRAFSTVVVG